jgi:hypothetical protein
LTSSTWTLLVGEADQRFLVDHFHVGGDDLAEHLALGAAQGRRGRRARASRPRGSSSDPAAGVERHAEAERAVALRTGLPVSTLS